MVNVDNRATILEAILDLLASESEPGVSDFTVVATAENGVETIAAIKVHHPDLLFLDISMPPMSGSEIIHNPAL